MRFLKLYHRTLSCSVVPSSLSWGNFSVPNLRDWCMSHRSRLSTCIRWCGGSIALCTYWRRVCRRSACTIVSKSSSSKSLVCFQLLSLLSLRGRPWKETSNFLRCSSFFWRKVRLFCAIFGELHFPCYLNGFSLVLGRSPSIELFNHESLCFFIHPFRSLHRFKCPPNSHLTSWWSCFLRFQAVIFLAQYSNPWPLLQTSFALYQIVIHLLFPHQQGFQYPYVPLHPLGFQNSRYSRARYSRSSLLSALTLVFWCRDLSSRAKRLNDLQCRETLRLKLQYIIWQDPAIGSPNSYSAWGGCCLVSYWSPYLFLYPSVWLQPFTPPRDLHIFCTDDVVFLVHPSLNVCFYGCRFRSQMFFPWLGIREVIGDRSYTSAFANGREAQNQNPLKHFTNIGKPVSNCLHF